MALRTSSTLIPFEIHITTETSCLLPKDAFVDFCTRYQAKPLLIELAQGDYRNQPMFSKIVHLPGLEEALQTATHYLNLLQEQSFPVRRIKIEVPSSYAHLFEHTPAGFENYYEWHGKINYVQPEKLYALCKKHKVHLSLNALKNEAATRFITLREFSSLQQFEARIDSLVLDLQNGNWELHKQQSEYCVYDTHTFLDNGWLPQ